MSEYNQGFAGGLSFDTPHLSCRMQPWLIPEVHVQHELLCRQLQLWLKAAVQLDSSLQPSFQAVQLLMQGHLRFLVHLRGCVVLCQVCSLPVAYK